MNCPYCQMKIPDNVTECKHCGGAFASEDVAGAQSFNAKSSKQSVVSEDQIEVPIPGVFKRKVIFRKDEIQFKKKIIKYEDIRWIAYHSLYQSVNLIPAGTTYTFQIGFDKKKISVAFSSTVFNLGNKKCEDAFGQIIDAAHNMLIPVIIKNLYNKIVNSKESVKIGNITLSKHGFSIERFMKKPQEYSWSNYYGYSYKEGMVHLFETEKKLITSVAMRVKNAVILPGIMSCCSGNI